MMNVQIPVPFKRYNAIFRLDVKNFIFFIVVYVVDIGGFRKWEGVGDGIRVVPDFGEFL